MLFSKLDEKSESGIIWVSRWSIRLLQKCATLSDDNKEYVTKIVPYINRFVNMGRNSL